MLVWLRVIFKRELKLIPERHLTYKLDNCRNAAIHELTSHYIELVKGK